MKKLLFLLCSCIIMTGCWNRKELNELAIAVGLAIDKTPDNDYIVSVQVVDPNEVTPRRGGGGRSPVTVYTQKANTLQEALRMLTTNAPRRIYLSHLRILVLGETVTKEGIGESLDLLRRSQELRSDFYIIAAIHKSGAEILQYISPLEKIPAQKLYKSLDISQKLWAPTHAVQLDELMDHIISNGKSAVLTGIDYEGKPNKGDKISNVTTSSMQNALKYKDLAVLRKDKIVGWLNTPESKGFNYITGNVSKTVGRVPCPGGGEFVLEVTNAMSRVRVDTKQERATVHITTNVDGNISEVRCKMDITDPMMIRKAEKNVEIAIEKLEQQAIEKAQKLKSDIFGFGDALYRHHPEKWRKINKNWHEKGFVNTEIHYETKVKIWRTGTTNKSAIKMLKE